MTSETVDFSIFVDMDRVVFRINRKDFFVPYNQVFKMALQLQVVAKYSKTLTHEHETWIKLTNAEAIDIQEYSSVKSYPQVKGRYDWKFDIDSELVHFYLADYHTSFHFAAALQLSFLIRLAGRKAKAWAGDFNKVKTAAAMLTDAEENYKLGIC